MIRITNKSQHKTLIRVLIEGVLEIASDESVDVEPTKLIPNYNKYLDERKSFLLWSRVTAEEPKPEQLPEEDGDRDPLTEDGLGGKVSDEEGDDDPEHLDGPKIYTEEELKSMHYTGIDDIAKSLGIDLSGNKVSKIKAILESQK